MPRKSFKFAAAFAVALSVSTPAFAAGMTFTIHNQSDYIINGFFIADGGDVGPNWMDFELNGDESADMAFSYDGPCEIEFVLGWLGEDGSTLLGDNTSIDICEASNIYFDGSQAYYD